VTDTWKAAWGLVAELRRLIAMGVLHYLEAGWFQLRYLGIPGAHFPYSMTHNVVFNSIYSQNY